VCGVWCVVCGVWCVVCGVWCVVCGVWCVVCGVSCVVCRVSCVVCRVSCVVCRVSCVVCSVSCVVCRVSCVVCCVLCVVRCALCVVRCALCVACCVLCVVCCVLCVVCCVLRVACCVLRVACCVLFAVCCVLCGVWCVVWCVCCVLCVVCCVLCVASQRSAGRHAGAWNLPRKVCWIALPTAPPLGCESSVACALLHIKHIKSNQGSRLTFAHALLKLSTCPPGMPYPWNLLAPLVRSRSQAVCALQQTIVPIDFFFRFHDGGVPRYSAPKSHRLCAMWLLFLITRMQPAFSCLRDSALSLLFPLYDVLFKTRRGGLSLFDHNSQSITDRGEALSCTLLLLQALDEVLPSVASKKVGKGGYMVLRPDSGDPIAAVLMVRCKLQLRPLMFSGDS